MFGLFRSLPWAAIRRCKAPQGDGAAGSPPCQLEIFFFLLPSPPSTTTESQFTARTFTNGFEITGGDTCHHRHRTRGSPRGQITYGDECLAYDSMVNKMLGFTTVSYAEPAVQRLPPPAIDPMRDAQRRHQR